MDDIWSTLGAALGPYFQNPNVGGRGMPPVGDVLAPPDVPPPPGAIPSVGPLGSLVRSVGGMMTPGLPSPASTAAGMVAPSPLVPPSPEAMADVLAAQGVPPPPRATPVKTISYAPGAPGTVSQPPPPPGVPSDASGEAAAVVPTAPPTPLPSAQQPTVPRPSLGTALEPAPPPEPAPAPPAPSAVAATEAVKRPVNPLLETLRGVQAPKPGPVQGVSTPAVPHTRATIQAGELLKLLQLLGAAGGAKGISLGQALGGR